MAGTNYGDDGGASFLESQLSTIQQGLANINNQLSSLNTGTFEGQQQSEVLSDRKKMYEQAIQQYTQLLTEIKSSGDSAKRASAMKEQATKGYLTGMGTKKGATGAEVLKDIADITGAGAAERQGIQANVDTNLASARGGLSSMFMDIAKTEGALADSAAARSGSSGSKSGGSGWTGKYNTNTGEEGEEDNKGDSDSNQSTITDSAGTGKNKDPNRIKPLDVLGFGMSPIIGGANILRKIANKKLNQAPAPIYKPNPQLKEFGMASMANNVFGTSNPVNQGTNNIFKKLTY